MPREADIKKLMTLYERRLQKLKEKVARQGHSVAPDVELEIEDIEEKLEVLEVMLEALQSDPGTDLPAKSMPSFDLDEELARMGAKAPSADGGRVINTGGGAYVEGQVNIDRGDFVGQDQITSYGGTDPEAIAEAFGKLYQALEQQPDTMQKNMTTQALEALGEEAKKGNQADEDKVEQGFKVILAMLPDIGEVAINTFINPIAGLSTAFQKIAQKARENLQNK